MNQYYNTGGNPSYHGGYIHPNANFYQGWPQSPMQQQPVKGNIPYSSSGKGNTCAYVEPGPVQYNKLKVLHWPSQDYLLPHPKGFAHTLHNQQTLEQHVPYRN
ncbi:hypothetical protein JOC75_003592 [Metabacillus crassostreae]|uniref:hypothetical protein n=1 Tax=Metabacillus crassostreae TaxID=929098 RepID=UPI00195E19E0|nr:hypothetical protein [Metabacillus crassostreae]MBM7605569.1 hypothetical protein [Metabacillus crassostreae]